MQGKYRAQRAAEAEAEEKATQEFLSNDPEVLSRRQRRGAEARGIDRRLVAYMYTGSMRI